MRRFNKLALKLIFLIVVAFTVSMIVFLSIATLVMNYIIKNNIQPENFIVGYKIYSISMMITPVIMFIIIFLIGINKRLKYLEYITNKVRNIKDTTYLEPLDIKGKDEITELANSINIMSERLRENYENEKKSEEVKNELIVAVSHDLRTPLTAVIGYLDLLNKHCKNEKQKKEYINIAYEKSIALKKLIDELFEYTKISANYVKLDKTRFNIAILVNQVVGESIALFKNKSIYVKLDINLQEVYCNIDVQKIVRVIENILRNAEKYSYENTEFKVSLSESDDEVKIIFQNVGDNIKSDNLEKIFEKMYRVDKARSNEKKDGSGLGLAISKAIVKQHGGDIWAECKDNTIKINLVLKKLI